MKKFLLILLPALALCTAAPMAQAHHDDHDDHGNSQAWHDVEKTVDALYPRLDNIRAKHDKFGASPKMEDQIAELTHGVKELTARVHDHNGDPDYLRKRGDELGNL